MNRLLLTLILLLGAFVRLFRLTHIGLNHDEVANWLIDRRIQQGNHAVYFQDAYGHEAGFHYLQTLFITLLGDNALALRLPAAFLGIILIAVSYQLGRVLYNRRVATIAILILAITFYPTFYSRLGLRAIMLPVFSGLSGYYFWQAFGRPVRVRAQFIARAQFVAPLLAAIFAGLALYTYMASRVVPIFYAFALLLSLWWGLRGGKTGGKWHQPHSNIRHILLFALLSITVAAPLFLYLRANPSAEFRISEIDAPLRALFAGDIQPVLQNAWYIVGTWGWHGDPLWRQNVANAPIFNPFTAILFYTGVILMLIRRQPADMFTLLWLATATIPSLVTVDAPSTIRMINMLPLLGVPIAQVIHKLSTLSPSNPQLSTGKLRYWWIICLTICTIWGLGRTLTYTHQTWPNGGDVPFVWQTAFTSAARWLDTAEPRPTTFIGWTPDTMDAPTIALALKNDALPRRFTSTDTLVYPLGDGDDHIRVIRPTTPDLPVHPALAAVLASTPDIINETDFTAYEIDATQLNSRLLPHSHIFNQQLAFAGHSDCIGTSEQCHIWTRWRLRDVITTDIQIFVHVLDDNGVIISQSDGFSADEQTLKSGDVIYQAHTINLTNAAAIHTGIYHPNPPYPRLLTEDGRDHHPLNLAP